MIEDVTNPKPASAAQTTTAPAAGGRRRRGPSSRVRDAAIAATLAELAEHGYSALSLEKVARRAGVNKTTLYRRWGTREELVLEAMLERAGEHIPVPDTGSLRQDLLQLARTAAANAATPEVAAMARVVASESGRDSRLQPPTAASGPSASRLTASSSSARSSAAKSRQRPTPAA